MIVCKEMYFLFQTSISSDHSHTILTGVLKVLLHCLNCSQSERVLQSMFPTQRSIVAKVSVCHLQSGFGCLRRPLYLKVMEKLNT